jgi:RNA polymerase sigma factor (sigma-70 family)
VFQDTPNREHSGIANPGYVTLTAHACPLRGASTVVPLRKIPNMISTHSTDAELIASALQGNQSAYTLLMARYRSPLYHFIYLKIHDRDDADDLTLEVFAKAFLGLQTYVSTHRFSTWLCRIAFNHCIDHLRKRRFDCVSIHAPLNKGVDFTHDILDTTPTAESRILQTESDAKVRRSVEGLKPKYQMMIALRYFDELSYEDIATELNIPLGTVKGDLFRAKEKLRVQWN